MISLVAMGTEMDEDVSWFTGCLISACMFVCVCLGESTHLSLSVCLRVYMYSLYVCVHIRKGLM